MKNHKDFEKVRNLFIGLIIFMNRFGKTLKKKTKNCCFEREKNSVDVFSLHTKNGINQENFSPGHESRVHVWQQLPPPPYVTLGGNFAHAELRLCDEQLCTILLAKEWGYKSWKGKVHAPA